MGMYTKWALSFTLKSDTPEETVSIIETLISDSPSPELLKTAPKRAAVMCNIGICQEGYRGVYEILMKGDFKNYDRELEWLLSLIEPHLSEWDNDVIGWELYEECLTPNVFAFKGGSLYKAHEAKWEY